ncbi:Por secretion system C-terminal sorting domain-containing protein [Mariniphaga anaerophila]|uniref:Por secretion system C-terminal sorting domain-containing protein n=1 Tax=Mariniphaga anaerophila TaxID=1484053 RepID=A0A1M4SWM9_9BACT|nr:glycosyl hydrolase family 28-related protein [Mariniphaga anaerophila]SHE36589.1 Por secretion system C-terminal sorting domain-containing protein [Mariniphaga anaerophila]
MDGFFRKSFLLFFVSLMLTNSDLLVAQNSIFHEDLEAENCPESNYNYGTFKSSSNAYWWTYKDCRKATGTYTIEGKSLILKNNTGSVESSWLNGGVNYVSFKVNKCWSSNEKRVFKLEIIPDNGSSTVSQQFSLDGNIAEDTEYSLDNINIQGLFKIKISNLTSSTAIVVDEIKWQSYGIVSETWETNILSDFEADPENSVLYDYSYAGYKGGEEAFPDVAEIAVVTDFGAVADDLIDDTQAFQDAIDYAASQGGGAVVIPKGKFLFNAAADDSYVTMKDNVVLKGSGNAEDGTILFLANYINEAYGRGMIYAASGSFVGAPYLSVTKNAAKGSHLLTVASTNGLVAGDAVRLRMFNPAKNGERQDDLSRLLSHPLPPETTWTFYKRFSPFECFFEIEEVVDGKTVKLKESLMQTISTEWNPRLEKLTFIENVGIENLRLESDFQGGYSHHLNWEVDYGWCGIELANVKNGWVKDLVIKNMVCDIQIASSKNVTVQNVVIEGLDGHHGVKTPSSSFCLVKDVFFNAFRTHTVGTEGGAHGNVFTNIGINYLDGMIDFHGGGFASHNLFECINNVYTYGGGAEQNMPHSGQYNVFWNLIGSKKQDSRRPGMDFFSGLWNYWDYYSKYGLNYECYKLYPKSVLAGVYHPDYLMEVEHSTTDRSDEWIEIEGFNQEGIRPASLYHYQLNNRLSGYNDVVSSNKKLNKQNVNTSGKALYAVEQGVIFDEHFGKSKLTVYDIQGKVIASSKVNINKGYMYPLNIPFGIYIISIEGERGNYVEKVVKNR